MQLPGAIFDCLNEKFLGKEISLEVKIASLPKRILRQGKITEIELDGHGNFIFHTDNLQIGTIVFDRSGHAQASDVSGDITRTWNAYKVRV